MSATSYQPRLKTAYKKEIRSQLQADLGLANLHQVPKLDKIVLNSGLGRSKDDKRVFETARNTLAKISGQRPVTTKARLSIASFKLRTGNPIGLMVTLRGDRMYEFLDRLINLVIPRFRDFRGLSRRSFDPSGNYSIGFREQSLFPELSFEETQPAHGLQATLIFDSQGPAHSLALLEKFGARFTKPKEGEDG